jgi:hypothetical protein
LVPAASKRRELPKAAQFSTDGERQSERPAKSIRRLVSVLWRLLRILRKSFRNRICRFSKNSVSARAQALEFKVPENSGVAMGRTLRPDMGQGLDAADRVF